MPFVKSVLDEVADASSFLAHAVFTCPIQCYGSQEIACWQTFNSYLNLFQEEYPELTGREWLEDVSPSQSSSWATLKVPQFFRDLNVAGPGSNVINYFLCGCDVDRWEDKTPASKMLGALNEGSRGWHS
jgi:hypothetical protein